MSLGIIGNLASFSTAATPVRFETIDEEIRAGLPNSQKRRDEVTETIDYYNGNFEPYQSDYGSALGVRDGCYNRRSIPYVRSIVNALTRRHYMADPKRVVTDQPEVTDYLASLYSKGRMSAKMKGAIKFAALGRVSAIQVVPNFPTTDEDRQATLAALRPAINFRVISSNLFEVWCSPDEPLIPNAVAVIDVYDNQRRCVLWMPDRVVTYTCRQWDRSPNTAGTRVFKQVSDEPNFLGVVPFAFVWWDEPVNDFWTWSPGDALKDVNESANARLTKIADDIIFTRPITYSKGVEPGWAPPSRYRATDIVPLPSSGGADTTIGSGVVEPALETTNVDLSYLEHDRAELEAHLEMQGEMHGVPKEQWRLRGGSAPSGVAIVSEQLPIIEACEERQQLLESSEKDLAALTLMVVSRWIGGVPGAAPVVSQINATLSNFDMSVEWPPLTKNRPGPDFDNHIRGMQETGLYSPIQAYMEAKAATRDEAYQHFAEAAEDEKYIRSIMPAEPQQQDDQQQSSDQQDQQQNEDQAP